MASSQNVALNNHVRLCLLVRRTCISSCPSFWFPSGCRLNFTWINQDRKSVNLPAPTYIDYVMSWLQNLLDDESVFPTKSGMQPNVLSVQYPLSRLYKRPGLCSLVSCYRQTCLSSTSSSVCSFIPCPLSPDSPPPLRATFQQSICSFSCVWTRVWVIGNEGCQGLVVLACWDWRIMGALEGYGDSRSVIAIPYTFNSCDVWYIFFLQFQNVSLCS